MLPEPTNVRVIPTRTDAPSNPLDRPDDTDGLFLVDEDEYPLDTVTSPITDLLPDPHPAPVADDTPRTDRLPAVLLFALVALVSAAATLTVAVVARATEPVTPVPVADGLGSAYVPAAEDPVLLTASGLTPAALADNATLSSDVLTIPSVCPDGCGTVAVTVPGLAPVVDRLFANGWTNETGSASSCLLEATGIPGCVVSDGEHVALLTTRDDGATVAVTRVDEP